MNITTDCLACIVRGSLDAAKLATDDTGLQEKIVKRIMKTLMDVDMEQPPPVMATKIQKAVFETTGVTDPYEQIKHEFNDFALSLYPDLEKLAADGSFETCVRLCIAGNIIDFGTHSTIGKQQILDTIKTSLKMEITGSISELAQACDSAGRILWIGDNCGEIVFDKLMLTKLAAKELIYAVRGGPTQNDATMEDAVHTGIDQMVRVIDTGAALPGVILDRCSTAFRRVYDNADLIIAKGQGNFETLPGNDPRIFFLFKAKCPVVAKHAGCNLNDMVILKGGGR